MRSAWISALLASGLLAGCGTSTGPSLDVLEQAQARWDGHHFTRYAYQLTEQGFFNTFAGHPIRLVVIDGVVSSAQFAGTADSVPADPAGLPAVDQLFAQAIAAERAGTLTAADFDTTTGLPTRLVFDGPPDALGSLLADDLELLP
jgi:hypothetical protein